MGSIIDVNTGETGIGVNGDVLRSSAIGSCIVVVLYDRDLELGGMVHIMVPGSSPDPENPESTRYAKNGIERLLSLFIGEGSSVERMEACIVGGSNVLRRMDDTIADDNISSVVDILTAKDIQITARSTGGFERRAISFDISEGSVQISVGSGPRETLYDFKCDERGVDL